MVMSIEEQVCSVKSGRKINRLGVKKEGVWWWNWSAYLKKYKVCTGSFPRDYWIRVCPAYTVAELGEMLPHDMEYYNCRSLGYKNKWFVQQSTEAETRAKMLIYLLKKKIILPRNL